MFDAIKTRLQLARRSFTVWFNGVVSAAVGTLLTLPVEQVIAYLPQMQPYLTSEAFRRAMVGMMVVNLISMVLRVRKTA